MHRRNLARPGHDSAFAAHKTQRGSLAARRTAVVRLFAFLALVCSGTAGAPVVHGSDLKTDEEVLLFPTPGSLSQNGRHWEVTVHGWVFEPERTSFLRRRLISQFKDAFELAPGEVETRIFERRIRWFMVDNERSKELEVEIGGNHIPMTSSSVDGHFETPLKLPVSRFPHTSRIQYAKTTVVTRDGDNRRFVTQLHLLPETGLSVLSDIDDTVKISHVRNKRLLAEHTFLKPYKAVPGMAKRFRGWQRAGAATHFVSGSPYQLYIPLSGFLAESGFPPATFHLKQFRLKDRSVGELFADAVQYKLDLIDPLLRKFPNREFVLIGDSGEGDPEVYGEIARRYPLQVRWIFIRQVDQEDRSAERYRKAFRGVKSGSWKLFSDGSDLPERL